MTKDMPSPDVALKDFFKSNAIFADVFNSFLFKNNEIIKADELEPYDSAFSTTILERGEKSTKTKKLNKYRDNIRRTSIGYFVILGIEDQDKIHYSMPVRKMLYDALSYSYELSVNVDLQDKTTWTVDEFLSNTSMGTRITPVITLVFYTGEKPWDGPRSLHDMMEMDDRISQFVPDYPLFVVDIGHDEDLSFSSKELSQLKEMLSAIYSETGDTNSNDIDKSIIALSGILASDKHIYHNAVSFEGGSQKVCKVLEERDKRITKEVEDRLCRNLKERDARITKEVEVKKDAEFASKIAEKDAIIENLMKQLAATKTE